MITRQQVQPEHNKHLLFIWECYLCESGDDLHLLLQGDGDDGGEDDGGAQQVGEEGWLVEGDNLRREGTAGRTWTM